MISGSAAPKALSQVGAAVTSLSQRESKVCPCWWSIIEQLHFWDFPNKSDSASPTVVWSLPNSSMFPVPPLFINWSTGWPWWSLPWRASNEIFIIRTAAIVRWSWPCELWLFSLLYCQILQLPADCFSQTNPQVAAPRKRRRKLRRRKESSSREAWMGHLGTSAEQNMRSLLILELALNQGYLPGLQHE